MIKTSRIQRRRIRRKQKKQQQSQQKMEPNGTPQPNGNHASDKVSKTNLLTAATSSPQVTEDHSPPLSAANGTTTTACTTIKASADGQLEVDTKGKAANNFRNYVNSEQQKRVEKFYTENHRLQTVESVQQLQKKYLQFKLARMSMWDCLEYLDSLVDESDPDTENSQMQHALQTAEAIRVKYPTEEYDWFPLTGLIHDLGKILSAKGGEPQWCVVGDTFPVGCQFSDKCVFPQFFKDNPDYKHPVYSTKYGIYKPNCGLSNVTMSWGHDEYLYQACVHNKSKLPMSALYIIRFHSFYPWHKENAYNHLTDKQDETMLHWVREFQKFDLYSKAHQKHSIAELKPYYQKLILKYFPPIIEW